ncbi:restriction endonuclease subunit S [Vibrio algivorus]|uniref:Type I restriction endonuclease EcoAI subunit S n=1 Tax=Vibrio algivorus TaxID=1667024 RepID=A0ABQ6EMY7_9VIBR|nr:restriction endonuclease subunit S [Vibrio algivorus]GLT14252.1 type I restriction endonuclease EcoAI subunit S [Vibrio algivorus]
MSDSLIGNSLITEHIDIWTSAIKAKSASGRGTSKKVELYGIKKLRELILELAVRGKLVPQDPNDEPASVLLDRIAIKKAQLVKEKKIKKPKALPEITDEEKPFELPSGWEWSQLGEVTNYGVCDKAESVDVDTHTWVLELEDVEKVTSKLLKKVRFSERRFKSSKNRFEANDVIYGKLRPYLDKVLIADEVGVCTTEMIPVRTYCDLLPKFLRLMMKSPYFIRYADESTHGMNLPRMGTDKARAALFPFAPLKEQHRIVAKVDELMALCDQLESQTENQLETHQQLVQTLLDTLTNCKNHAELQQNWALLAQNFDTLFTTEQSIDLLKQTILQLAVMGKLVPQDPNDEPASKLLERIAAEKEQLIKEKKIKKQKALPPINEDEKPFELPNGWEWCRIFDVSMFTTSGSRDWAKYYSESGALFVTMGNLSRGSYQLRLDNKRYVQPPKDGEGSRTRLETNDLLISITGDVGNLGLIPENFGEAYINQHTCLLRFMPETQGRFFPEFMRSPMAKFQFDAPQRGIKNSFRLSDVAEMVLALPPKQEQHRIVAKVDELMAICDDLKSKLAQSQQTQLHLTDAIVENAY